MLATYTIFSDLMRITLPKLHVKLQPHSLKIFWVKVEEVQKTHVQENGQQINEDGVYGKHN